MGFPVIHEVSDYAPLWVSIFPADVQLYVFSYRPAGVQTRTGQKPQSGAVNRAKGSDIPAGAPWGHSNRYFRYFAGPHKLLELTVCYGHGGRPNPRVRRIQATPVGPRTHRQPKHFRVVHGVIWLAWPHHSPCSADGRVSAQHAGCCSRQSQRGRQVRRERDRGITTCSTTIYRSPADLGVECVRMTSDLRLREPHGGECRSEDITPG